MTRPFDGTLGSLVGRLEALRIECLTCGRFGRYNVSKLIERHGPRYLLAEWLQEQTRDCSNKQAAGVTRACGAVMPDLVELL
jgi:hypothetical protein